MAHFRQCARPVIFETGSVDVPYSISGTAFLVGYRQRLFAVTARHVVGRQPIDNVLIFPSDRARKPLSVVQWWQLPEDPNDPDRVDLLVMEADIRRISGNDRRTSHAFEIESLPTDWFGARFSSTFFVLGYPTEHNEVDYDALNINTKQYLLKGTYRGVTTTADCHEVSVENPLGLATFNGLSGSPVWCLPAGLGVRMAPVFCGVAIRGTASSKIIRFLSSFVIRSMLAEAASSPSPRQLHKTNLGRSFSRRKVAGFG